MTNMFISPPISSGGVHYKNIYCAACHLSPTGDLWNALVSSESEIDLPFIKRTLGQLRVWVLTFELPEFSEYSISWFPETGIPNFCLVEDIHPASPRRNGSWPCPGSSLGQHGSDEPANETFSYDTWKNGTVQALAHSVRLRLTSWLEASQSGGQRLVIH